MTIQPTQSNTQNQSNFPQQFTINILKNRVKNLTNESLHLFQEKSFYQAKLDSALQVITDKTEENYQLKERAAIQQQELEKAQTNFSQLQKHINSIQNAIQLLNKTVQEHAKRDFDQREIIKQLERENLLLKEQLLEGKSINEHLPF
jgi:hypothetical protein